MNLYRTLKQNVLIFFNSGNKKIFKTLQNIKLLNYSLNIFIAIIEYELEIYFSGTTLKQ